MTQGRRAWHASMYHVQVRQLCRPDLTGSLNRILNSTVNTLEAKEASPRWSRLQWFLLTLAITSQWVVRCGLNEGNWRAITAHHHHYLRPWCLFEDQPHDQGASEKLTNYAAEATLPQCLHTYYKHNVTVVGQQGVCILSTHVFECYVFKPYHASPMNSGGSSASNNYFLGNYFLLLGNFVSHRHLWIGKKSEIDEEVVDICAMGDRELCVCVTWCLVLPSHWFKINADKTLLHILLLTAVIQWSEQIYLRYLHNRGDTDRGKFCLDR